MAKRGRFSPAGEEKARSPQLTEMKDKLQRMGNKTEQRNKSEQREMRNSAFISDYMLLSYISRRKSFLL